MIDERDVARKSDRAVRAQQLLDDDILNEAIEAMKREALHEFLTAHRWWWGDRRRRLAAERLREIEAFKAHLDRHVRFKPPKVVPMGPMG